ncbi:hypothetical protein SPHFLASMR4Y_01502 [Sphingorhabdus sp. SMR4y]|nr:hypothetical protein SPHFLASMR4Y_01502 [Sphingorhabdus sp. SMR4y]
MVRVMARPMAGPIIRARRTGDADGRQAGAGQAILQPAWPHGDQIPPFPGRAA